SQHIRKQMNQRTGRAVRQHALIGENLRAPGDQADEMDEQVHAEAGAEDAVLPAGPAVVHGESPRSHSSERPPELEPQGATICNWTSQLPSARISGRRERPMTEAEWLAATNPTRMLTFLRDRPSARKCRLFASACCRAISPLFPTPAYLELIELAERFADQA